LSGLLFDARDFGQIDPADPVKLRFKCSCALRVTAGLGSGASESIWVNCRLDAKIAFLNLALNKLVAFQGAFQAMEQRFVPIAVQTLGHRFTWRFDPRATQGGKLLWISLSGENGPHDALACFSGNIADDIS
jgi:hypothetical protein